MCRRLHCLPQSSNGKVSADCSSSHSMLGDSVRTQTRMAMTNVKSIIFNIFYLSRDNTQFIDLQTIQIFASAAKFNRQIDARHAQRGHQIGTKIDCLLMICSHHCSRETHSLKWKLLLIINSLLILRAQLSGNNRNKRIEFRNGMKYANR